jgi:Trypsin
VLSVKSHPNYNSNLMSNDVAIWKVALVSGDASYINTTFAFDDGTASAPGTMLDIIGWGTTRVGGGGSLSKKLLEAAVPVSTSTECSTAYPKVHASSICAGFYATGGVDTCQGDSYFIFNLVAAQCSQPSTEPLCLSVSPLTDMVALTSTSRVFILESLLPL